MNKVRKTPDELIIGQKYMVHAYKYNGWLYRAWEYPRLVYEDDDLLVFDLINTKIYSAEYNSNRVFKSINNNPIIWVFLKHDWFNFLVNYTLKNIKHTFPKIYINIASKFIFEEGCIKYFDFDLDFKSCVIENYFVLRELDIFEFEQNSIAWSYPTNLINKVKDTKKRILDLYDQGFFNSFIDKTFFKKIYNNNNFLNFKWKEILNDE